MSLLFKLLATVSVQYSFVSNTGIFLWGRSQIKKWKDKKNITWQAKTYQGCNKDFMAEKNWSMGDHKTCNYSFYRGNGAKKGDKNFWLKAHQNRLWLFWWYSARRLMGSRIIESVAYCNQILLAQLYINSTQKTSVNWIIRLLLSLSCRPKVNLLSGGHCNKDGE